ncbi:MAG: alkaline phosphatase family protein [Myxococcaceae bacterium]|nr:alkaline phosphatase family protein [Myxococcaceae bacterium]MCI0669511.1 alkaline phosphatase family protein [Myxococcaceae bacterium]
MRVALLFIDGVGIGRSDPSVNPLARRPYLLSHFEDGSGTPLPAGGALHRVDPTFGVPGRPQSASNQTALLTAQPAPRHVGCHVLGFPNAPLRALLAEHSIVHRLVRAGRTATFANCYPAGYLDALGLPRRASAAAELVLPPRAKRRLRPSATTLAFAAAGVPFRTLDDLRAGNGLTHDIDGCRSRDHGFDAPLRTPEEAAHVLLSVAEGADFTLFEHHLADEAGHAQDADAAEAALGAFDTLLRTVVSRRPEDLAVVVCSDHGNVEDLSTRNHTLHPVPVLTFGAPEPLPHALVTVADVGQLVLSMLGVEA